MIVAGVLASYLLSFGAFGRAHTCGRAHLTPPDPNHILGPAYVSLIRDMSR